MAGTVLFPIIYVAEGATRPEYDAMRQAISALMTLKAGIPGHATLGVVLGEDEEGQRGTAGN